VHRRHNRLENLRTIILADNLLQEIQLHLPHSLAQDSASSVSEDSADQQEQTSTRNKLMFTNLSMLDVSNNNISCIPVSISEVHNLSTFNISGNSAITDLPPEMGVLNRLWNLNTAWCSLQEPLASMAASKHYKTMDIIGYLKSILEDAKPYARMKLMVVGVQVYFLCLIIALLLLSSIRQAFE